VLLDRIGSRRTTTQKVPRSAT